MRRRLRRKRPAGVVVAIAILFAAGGEAAAQSGGGILSGLDSDAGPVQIEADMLDVTDEDGERISVFRGDVTVLRGETIIKSAVMHVFSDIGEGGGGQQGVKRIEATGGVYVNSGTQTATSQSAVYDLVARTIHLIGDVVLTEDEDVFTGAALMIYLDSDRAELTAPTGGRVRAIVRTGGGD